MWRQIRRLFVREPPRVHALATVDLANTSQIESYRAILREIAQIARDNGFEQAAHEAEALMGHLDSDGELFAKCVGAIWGKDGVVECPIGSNVPIGDAQASSRAFQQRQRLYELVAMLIEKLEEDGMYYPQLDAERKWFTERAGKTA